MRRILLIVVVIVTLIGFSLLLLWFESPKKSKAACEDGPCPQAFAARCDGITFPDQVSPGQTINFRVKNVNVGTETWHPLAATKTSEGSGIKLHVNAFNNAISFNYPFHVNGSYWVWPEGKKSAADESGERETMTGIVWWGAYADTCYGNCYRRKSGFRINFCPVPEITCKDIGCDDPTCPLQLTVPNDISPGTYQINTYVFSDGGNVSFGPIGQCDKSVTVVSSQPTPAPTSAIEPTSPIASPTPPPQTTAQPTRSPTSFATRTPSTPFQISNHQPSEQPATNNPVNVPVQIVISNPYAPYRSMTDATFTSGNSLIPIQNLFTSISLSVNSFPQEYSLVVHTNDGKTFQTSGVLNSSDQKTISLTLANPLFVFSKNILEFVFNQSSKIGSALKVFDLPFQNIVK